MVCERRRQPTRLYEVAPISWRRRYESVTRSFIPTLLPGRFPSAAENEKETAQEKKTRRHRRRRRRHRRRRISFIPGPIKNQNNKKKTSQPAATASKVASQHNLLQFIFI